MTKRHRNWLATAIIFVSGVTIIALIAERDLVGASIAPVLRSPLFWLALIALLGSVLMLCGKKEKTESTIKKEKAKKEEERKTDITNGDARSGLGRMEINPSQIDWQGEELRQERDKLLKRVAQSLK